MVKKESTDYKLGVFGRNKFQKSTIINNLAISGVDNRWAVYFLFLFLERYYKSALTILDDVFELLTFNI